VAQRLTKAVDRMLDRVFDEPLDVPTAEEARVQIEKRPDSNWPSALSGAAEWAAVRLARGKLAARLGGRVAGSAGSKIVGRAAIPVTVAVDVGLTARDGLLELQVLASYLIARLRQAGLAIDRDLVRRVATSIYLQPDAQPNLQRSSAQLVAAVARRWASGAVPGLRPHRRRHSRRRIDAIAELDLHQLRPTAIGRKPSHTER
jgi:hypothetical protein